MSSPQIVIIGAGLIGLSCADALQRRGAGVTVIDARSGPVRGTSYSNSGMIHPSQARSWALPAAPHSPADKDADLAVLSLANRSCGAVLRRMESLGLARALGRPKGCYQIYGSVDAARAAQSLYADLGIEANVVIDPARTFSNPALYFPGDRSADAREYGVALADAIRSAGGTLIYDAPGVRLRRDDEDGIAVALDGHRFRADHVIIAAGAQTSDVLSQLELRINITPVRGWAVDFALPETPTLPPVPVMDAGSRTALTVFHDRVRLSGSWNADSPAPMLKRWEAIVPGLVKAGVDASGGEPLSIWSGLRPVSGAGRPYISSTSIPGLWVNAGHGHLGWTLCAGSGELMAEMILDGREDARFVYQG